MKNISNINLRQARKNKQDEFYTQLTDIEKELKHYREHFKDKVVYCNCDDPRVSKFFQHFAYGFEHLDLKKLITTCYKNQNPDLFSQNDSEKAIYIEYKRDKSGHLIPYPEYMKSITGKYKGGKDENDVLNFEEIGIGHLKGDGDFRSEECTQLLKKADIVVTNPPFSLFREYVAQLMEYNKKFIIIGNTNAITYKEIFKWIKENKIWLGVTPRGMNFKCPGNDLKSTNAVWFTNLDIKKRHEDLFLYKKYYGNEKEYPKYDNYDAINVDKTKHIPMDYKAVIGVPLTFMDKYNPKQFEIIGMSSSAGYDEDIVGIPYLGDKDARPLINGKNIYARIFIKNRKTNL